ncbi:MAG: DUF1499 domain-containing protein [Methylococcales bacterium]|jgi:uncharacterized protein (DUF1499 family)|nr:DUF1499 domain-containing protein [Methylococcales bacterium]MEE2765927.1 DUF1499 domain-containing protein [Pseudomonadota bacterium]
MSLGIFLVFATSNGISQSLINNDRTYMNKTALDACPESPNCVCSQVVSKDHFVAPLTFTGNAQKAFSGLKTAISELPGTRIIVSNNTYLHAEFQTRWLKFTDDVEAVLDKVGKKIDIRSASRVGYWDLGTNRRRVETIRRAMLSTPK